MLKEGDIAPKIHLETDSGETFDLDQARGKKVVLFFYPKASTPGCTVEACEFRDTFQKFDQKGVVVLGISKDTPKAQTTFKQSQGLPYRLLCDVDRKVAEAYGVWKEKNMYGKKVMGVERTTFVIDEQGKIERIFSKVKPVGHAEEVLAGL